LLYLQLFSNIAFLPPEIQKNVVNLADYVPETGKGGPPVKIKFAQGLYKVKLMNRTEIRFPVISKSPGSKWSESDYFEFKDSINFESLELDEITDIRPGDLDDKAWNIINATVNQCWRGRAVCYEALQHQGCSRTRTCPLLVIIAFADDDDVRKRKYETFKVSIVSYKVNDVTNKHPIQPDGWLAVGFSHDMKMGDDLIIMCYERNQTSGVAVFFSEQRDIHYDPKSPAQAYVTNKKIISSVRDNYMICSFTIPTKMEADLSKYKFATRKSLNFTFDDNGDPTYLLFAQGASVKDTWNMTYHEHREFVDIPFTARGFYNAAIFQNRRGEFISKKEKQKPAIGLILGTVLMFVMAALLLPSGCVYDN